MMLSNLLAARDFVTGLPGRDGVLRYLSSATDRSVVVIYVRIERLAGIEHRIGRFATDEALSDFAERVKARVRSTDLVARIDSDFFSIVVSRITPAGVESVIERVRGIRRLSTLTHAELEIETSVWVEKRRASRASTAAG